MPATSLRVSLLSVTPNAEALVYANAKQCTSDPDAYDIFMDASWKSEAIGGIPKEKQRALIRRVMASGHLGIVEPVVFSFGVAGVSRALSHQLVRQRIASFCQQSQRTVKAKNFDYVVPPSILKGGPHENCQGETANTFYDIMRRIEDAYDDLLSLGIPAEDARFVLPNACETKVVVTMNARSLLHFFEQRCCLRAQWEIRAMANEMLRLCKKAVPVLFETAGARCERKGFCEEEKSCGRAPRLKDVMERYKESCNG